MRKESPTSCAKVLFGDSAGAPSEAISTGGGSNNPGISAAVIQRSTPAGRASFVGNTRPSAFHSRSVSTSAGPNSFPSTRMNQASAIVLIIQHQASRIQYRQFQAMKLLLIDGHYYVYRSFFAIP